MIRISAQSDVIYRSYCPKTTQSGPNWVLNQKNVVLLLGKVENDKYTKNWNLASRTCGGMFLLKTMWELLIILWRSHRGQFKPSLSPKKCFLFNFTRILWCFWDLEITLFYIPKDVAFAEFLFFSNILVFHQWIGLQNGTKL